jgi:hypothetical protein
MEIFMLLFLIVTFLLVVVLYQSRQEPVNVQLYFKRMMHLVMLIVTFLKDIGVDAATRFRQIDWNVTTVV